MQPVAKDLRKGVPGSEPATQKQIAFIQKLIAEWDPSSDIAFEEASRKRLAGAIEIAGVTDYETQRAFGRLNVAQASDIIPKLKKYDG